jgi:hypothetical protein
MPSPCAAETFGCVDEQRDRDEAAGTRPSNRRWLSLFGRGVAVGAASIVVTTAVVGGILLGAGDDGCSDLCAGPALKFLGLVFLSFPVVLAIIGPLMARLFRFPWPVNLVFVAPPGSLFLLLCFGPDTGPIGRWLIDHLGADILIMLVIYGLGGWLAGAGETAAARRR